MRHRVFEDLQVKDINQDGIDEILYEEYAWFLGGGSHFLRLYSPKYGEWFWRQDSYSLIGDEMVWEEIIRFSPNLKLEKYRVFYEYLRNYEDLRNK